MTFQNLSAAMSRKGRFGNPNEAHLVTDLAREKQATWVTCIAQDSQGNWSTADGEQFLWQDQNIVNRINELTAYRPMIVDQWFVERNLVPTAWPGGKRYLYMWAPELHRELSRNSGSLFIQHPDWPGIRIFSDLHSLVKKLNYQWRGGEIYVQSPLMMLKLKHFIDQLWLTETNFNEEWWPQDDRIPFAWSDWFQMFGFRSRFSLGRHSKTWSESIVIEDQEVQRLTKIEETVEKWIAAWQNKANVSKAKHNSKLLNDIKLEIAPTKEQDYKYSTATRMTRPKVHLIPKRMKLPESLESVTTFFKLQDMIVAMAGEDVKSIWHTDDFLAEIGKDEEWLQSKTQHPTSWAQVTKTVLADYDDNIASMLNCAGVSIIEA